MRLSLPDLATCVLAVCAALALAAPAAPQVTSYVPPSDPAYRDLDVLVTSGLVEGLILGQGPLSGATFARAAEQARVRLAARARSEPPLGVKPRVMEALARIETRFPDHAGSETHRPGGAAFDATWADSPSRDLPSRYRVLELGDSLPDFIDADVNPLLQRNQGRSLADGATLTTEAWGEVGIGRRFLGYARPRLWLESSGVGGEDAQATLVTGYLRGLFGNLSVDVGRNSVHHGHSKSWGPVFSGNARAMDMLRLSLERPGRLPWLLRHLGPMGFSLMAADMGSDQDIPRSKLFVLEAGIRPHPQLELGGALLNHQLGEGAPTASFAERLKDLLFLEQRRSLPFDRRVPISDKALALDARLTLPSLGTDLYVEMLTTDDHNLFFDLVMALEHNAAWTGGVRVSGLGPDGRTDLWIEGTRVGLRTYTHHQFSSGLTLDRRVLGAPVGPLAAGIQGGGSWTGRTSFVGVTGAWERYSGDLWQWRGADRPFRVSDNPDEIRVRTTVDWTRQGAATGLRTTVRLGYEHVTRFDFTDRSRSNFLARVGVGWVW